MKLEGYDNALLSYTLATTKMKSGLLNAVTRAEDISLTPPRPEPAIPDEECRSLLTQMLTNIQEALINRTIIPVHQLISLGANTRQLEEQGGTLIEHLLHELRQVCKVHPGIAYQLDLNEGNNSTFVGSLKTEPVCNALADLLKHYGFNEGANLLRSQYF
ncbi:hypothetical protein FQA39_LY09939 [Lamprigera yunnana]|nr:hypothetical protein FQA39_LY09939 [Lamprigera yunnana]